MLEKIKIDFLSLYRSKWKYIFFIPIALFFAFLFYKLGFFARTKFGDWTRIFHYVDLLTMGLSFILGVRAVQGLEDFDLSLPLSREKTVLALYMANFSFIAFILAFILIFFLAAGLALGYSFAYIFNVLINVVLTNILAYNFSLILGMVLARLIKSKLAYVFALLPILFFTPIFLETILFYSGSYDPSLWSSLSFLDDNIFYTFLTATGNVYDKIYFLDRVVPLVFSIFLLSVLLLSFSPKKIVYLALAVALSFLSAFTLKGAKNNSYNMDMALFDLTSLEAREKFLDNFGSDIEITSYKMDLKLGEKLSNSCQIEILNKSEKSLTELTMALNANLSISEASLDENNIAYNRQGQAIILSDFNLQPGQRGTLLLDYQGTIKDIMNPGILLNYSSNTSSNLLPAMNWYPLIKTEQELPYELQVSYKKRLISNLNDFEVLDEGQSFLKGQTKYLYISDGFYRAKEIGGLEYVGSEEVIGHYLEDYDWTINSYLENYATNKNPKKIIIYPGAYSQALEIDENLMVSEF